MKKIIFGSSKFRLVLAILAISLMMIGCGNSTEPTDNDPTGDNSTDLTPIGPSTPTTKTFTLTTVPATLPVENVWVITDNGSPTTANFDALEALLNSDAATSRKITLNFPNIEAIPAEAFYDRNSNVGVETIIAVSAPKATYIGNYAFQNSTALTDASFPVVTSIGNSAFRGSTALTTASFPLATTIERDAFYYSKALTTVDIPKALTIGDFAFAECTALTTASFPVATTIGENAFFLNTALTTVSFPVATTIGENAFFLNTALTTVSFPVATTIEKNAFFNCKALTTMEIATGSTLGSIHVDAFGGTTVTANITVTTRDAANKGLLIARGFTDANITLKP